MLRRRGLSLMEVMVASVIFMLAVAGIYGVLGSARRPMAGSETDLQSLQYSQSTFKNYRYLVKFSTMSTGSGVSALVPNVYNSTFINLPGSFNYDTNATIEITDTLPGRKVTMAVITP